MTCQYKRTETTDCLGRDVSMGINATAICNCSTPEYGKGSRGEICPRYYREASLAVIKPKIFCCAEMLQLFHRCAEDDGYLAGSFDIRTYPNDGKDVWRNYERVRFRFCPFCGQGLLP